MGAREWSCLFAAAGHLALALVSLARGRQSVVARPLALLCFALFVWNFATVVERVSDAPMWGVTDAFFTAMTPPLAILLIATFVGASRAWPVKVAFVAFGALALSSAVGFVSPWGREWSSSGGWTIAFLAGWLPVLAIALTWLVRHLVQATGPDEKARTRTFLAAFALGGAFATTDEMVRLGVAVPHLAPIGTLVGTFLVATTIFRFRLFERDLSLVTGVYAGALASAGVVAYVVLLRLAGGGVAAGAAAAAIVTLVLVVATREVVSSRAVQRERVEHLTVLGRLTAQMAHDIKNPLAALLGAARVLDDAPRGQPWEEGLALRRILVEQAERIRAIVDKYDRLGRVEPVASRVRVNDLVRRVVDAQSLATSDVRVALDLLDPLPECDADPDLLASALENVVRNACEAMPGGGSLCVRTRLDVATAGARAVVVRVEDTGEGMDARRAERAFDDFYTTKPTGNGLGLAFVRRVALAHGGSVSLASRPGEGTAVELRLPAVTV